MVSKTEFGVLLRTEREARNIGLRAFARMINYSPGHLSKVEHGQADPTPEFVVACDRQLALEPPLIDRVTFTPRQAARFPTAQPAQLPICVGELVGRDDELNVLTRKLEITPRPRGEAPVVVLHGPPGIGKTVLALRWGRDHANRHPDGTLFSDLNGYAEGAARRGPGDVLEDWLRSLGVPAERMPATVDDRASLFRAILTGKRILIVLDNVADATQIEPLLPHNPGSAVLVLSRRDLSGSIPAATQVPLPGLEPTHALKLLRTIVGPARLDAEPDAASDLAQHYAPLPLALQLLGEYIAARTQDDLRELAAQAGNDLTGQGESPLRAAFAWSYGTLSAPAALLFRALGMHGGADVGLDLAAAMLGRDALSTQPLLAELAAARLLQPLSTNRYRIHNLLRSFAVELANTTLPEDVRTRTVLRAQSWYLHSALSANTVLAPLPTVPAVPAVMPRVTPRIFSAHEVDEALAWCDQEADNLLAATEQAFDLEMHRQAWLLPVVLYPWLRLRAAWRHWMRGTSIGLLAARKAGDRAGEAWCLHSSGRCHQELRRYSHARRCFAGAAAIREEIDDHQGLGWSTFELGAVHLALGQAPEARTHLDRSLRLFATHQVSAGTAMARVWLGKLHCRLGQPAAAEEHLRRGLDLFVELGDTAGQALALSWLAQTRRAEGHPADALRLLDRSLRLRTAAHDRGGEARAHAFRAGVLDEMGDLRVARRSLLRALTLFERLLDPRAVDVRARLAVLDLIGLHTTAMPANLPAAC